MSSVRQKMAATHKAQNKQFEADKRGFLPLQEPTATLKPLVEEVEEVEEVAPEVTLEVEETTPAPEKPKTAKTTKTAKTKKPAPKGKKS